MINEQRYHWEIEARRRVGLPIYLRCRDRSGAFVWLPYWDLKADGPGLPVGWKLDDRGAKSGAFNTM